MRKEFSHSDVCETAAVRVQYWFKKDRGGLMPLYSALKLQDLHKKYKYDLLKPPRIPFQIDPLPLKSYLCHPKKKKGRKTLSVTSRNLSKGLPFVMEGAQLHD